MIGSEMCLGVHDTKDEYLPDNPDITYGEDLFDCCIVKAPADHMSGEFQPVSYSVLEEILSWEW